MHNEYDCRHHRRPVGIPHARDSDDRFFQLRPALMDGRESGTNQSTKSGRGDVGNTDAIDFGNEV